MKGSEPTSPPPEWFKPLIVILAGPLFSKFISGTALGQTALMVPQLDEDDSSSFSEDEVTWIGCISMLGTFISTCINGYLSNTFGRMRSNQVCYLTCCVGFMLLSTSKSFVALLLGRFIVGFGTGFSMLSSVYIAEISPPLYRGLFLSLISVFSCLGHLFVHFFGCYISWTTTTASLFIISLLGLILSLPLYESPQWLVQQGNIPSARRSLEQIGCLNVDGVLKELQANTTTCTEKNSLKMFKKPEVWKPLLINTTMTTLGSISCTHMLIVDPISFIKDFPTAFDPFDFTVVLSMIRLISLVLCLYLMRKLGRRTIGAFSGFSTAAVLLGIFVCLRLERWHPSLGQKHSWVFNFAFILLAITTNIGMFQLPWTLSNEMFPLRVRGLLSVLNTSLIMVFLIGLLKFYRKLVNSLGLEAVILIFAATAFMFAVAAQTVLVETHGKTLAEIESEFRGVKQPKCEKPIEKKSAKY